MSMANGRVAEQSWEPKKTVCAQRLCLPTPATAPARQCNVGETGPLVALAEAGEVGKDAKVEAHGMGQTSLLVWRMGRDVFYETTRIAKA